MDELERFSEDLIDAVKLILGRLKVQKVGIKK